MRPLRVMQYVSPDDWKDERVVPKKYFIAEDGRILGVRLVGLEMDLYIQDYDADLRGPRRVPGVFADADDGCRVHFPERDKGRNFGKLEDDRRPNGHVWLHKWPLTPIEELQTPWVSVYGHCPGEDEGMQFGLIAPLMTRIDDVFCVIGRIETYRAERILAQLGPDAPPRVRTFLLWLCAPGKQARHCAEALGAQWITYVTPSALWCCSVAEADALWRAIAPVLAEDLREVLKRDKEPVKDYREFRHHPRRKLAEHLQAVTSCGETGRYLAAAAFLSLGAEGILSFRSALARQAWQGMTDDPGDQKLLEGLGLTDEDCRRLALARKELGLA